MCSMYSFNASLINSGEYDRISLYHGAYIQVGQDKQSTSKQKYGISI